MVASLAAGMRSAAAEEPTLVGTADIGTEYSYRGILRSGPAASWSVAGEVGGWRGQIWESRPFRSGEAGELQSSLGRRWEAGDRLRFELRGTHFWYVHHPIRGTASHSFELAADIDWQLDEGWYVKLTPFGDIRFHSLGGELAVGRAIALVHWGTFLHWRVFAGTVDGHHVAVGENVRPIRDAYAYWGTEIRLPYRIAARTSVYAEVNLTDSRGLDPAWSPMRRGSGSRSWFKIGAQYEL